MFFFRHTFLHMRKSAMIFFHHTFLHMRKSGMIVFSIHFCISGNRASFFSQYISAYAEIGHDFVPHTFLHIRKSGIIFFPHTFLLMRKSVMICFSHTFLHMRKSGMIFSPYISAYPEIGHHFSPSPYISACTDFE